MYDPEHYEEPTDPPFDRKAVRNVLVFIIAFWVLMGLTFWATL